MINPDLLLDLVLHIVFLRRMDSRPSFSAKALPYHSGRPIEPQHITMHCARHSFAVLAINKGMPIESISRILGHTNITTTQIYAKITMQKLHEDMVAFEKSLSEMNKYDPENNE